MEKSFKKEITVTYFYEGYAKRVIEVPKNASEKDIKELIKKEEENIYIEDISFDLSDWKYE